MGTTMSNPHPPDRLADRLRQLWRQGNRPDLDAFLAEAGPVDSRTLVEILRADQSEQWSAGTPVAAEEYLRRYPAVAADTEAALDLIHNEYIQAERHGRTADTEQFVRRFPAHADTLRLQIDLHRAVAANGASTGPHVAGSSIGRGTPTMAQAVSAGARSDRFGRYRVLGTLGQGGMGTVYLAHDEQLDRRVALKVPRFGVGDTEQVERFVREARIAGGFHHAHLCPVYDVGSVGGVYYITMPVIEGESLAARLARSGPLPPLEAVRLAATVARAVEVANAAGVVHRDLKPANIMLDPRGEPVVMDFGLARRGPAAGDGMVTASGVFVGTPAYAAPEQMGSSSVTPAADVYALGAILFEMLTGRVPFDGMAADMMRRKLTDDPSPPSRRASGISPELDRVCLKALATSVQDRFERMSEFANALETCANGRPRTRPTRRRALLVAAAGAIVLVAAGFALWPNDRQNLLAIDPLPVQSVWVGSLSFDPENPRSWQPAGLWVTDRDGPNFRAVAETNNGNYAWIVKGTLDGDQIRWKYVEIVREKTPTGSVENGAIAEGTCDGNMIEVKFHDPIEGSRTAITLQKVDRDSAAAQAVKKGTGVPSK